MNQLRPGFNGVLSTYCHGHQQWFQHYLTSFGGSLLACPKCLKRAGHTIKVDRLGAVITDFPKSAVKGR